MIIQARTWNFTELLHFFVCQFTVSLYAFSSMSFHVVGTRYCLCVTFFATPVIFLLLQHKYGIQTSLKIVQQLFHLVCIPSECIPNFHGQKMMWVHQDPQVPSMSSTWEPYFAFFQRFWCHRRIPMRIIMVFDEPTDIPNFGTFHHPSPNRTSSNCLSQNNPANGCPYKFRSRSTTGSLKIVLWLWSCMSWKTYPYVWTLWFGYFEQSGSILQCFLSVRRYCISCLFITTWTSRNNIHDFCSSHLRCRWALFSENCVGSRIVFRNVSPEHHFAFILL